MSYGLHRSPIDRMRDRLWLEVVLRLGPMELFPFGRPPFEETLLDAFIRAFPEPVDGFRPSAIWIFPDKRAGVADFLFTNGPDGRSLAGAAIRLTCAFSDLNAERAREILAQSVIDS